MKFPRKLGRCADQLYELRQSRLALQKQVDQLRYEEHQLREHIINTLPKSEASGVAGQLARASVVVKEEPTVTDEQAFRRYLARTRRYELAIKLRPAASAIRELWDDGKEVPGIGRFNVVTISLNKL